MLVPGSVALPTHRPWKHGAGGAAADRTRGFHSDTSSTLSTASCLFSRQWPNASNFGYGSYTNAISRPYPQVSICVSLPDLNLAELDHKNHCRLSMMGRWVHLIVSVLSQHLRFYLQSALQKVAALVITNYIERKKIVFQVTILPISEGLPDLK